MNVGQVILIAFLGLVLATVTYSLLVVIDHRESAFRICILSTGVVVMVILILVFFIRFLKRSH